MQCPYCGNEMAEGYIQCRDGVFWSDKLRPVAAIPVLRKGKLIPLHAPTLSNRTRAAFANCCESCGKVIIEFPK